MGELALQIGGRTYSIACRDGEEAHLEALAATVDRKTADARLAVGDTSEVRQLLLAALLLADELQEQAKAKSDPAPDPTANADLAALETLATRIEHVAGRLESRG